MPNPRPLLSICIPTFNRGPFLADLLASLAPQLAPIPGQPFADLLVSDNASTDNTATVVADFQARGLAAHYVRNPTNLGADANFLRCLALARGKYVWVLGDDDLVMPGAIPALLSLLAQGEPDGGFDLVYLSSFGFAGSLLAPPASSVLEDRFHRFAEVVTDGAYLLEKINALVGLISVILINRDRLESIPHPPIGELTGTNLLQAGWIFPLIQRRCRVLYVWQRLVGYRHFNSGGWGICEVFGLRLHRIASRYFSADSELTRSLMNGVLRYWLPDSIMLARRGKESAMHVEDIAGMLRPTFRRDWRFWVFVYPTARWPLPAARLAHALLRTINRSTRIVQALWRHLFRSGLLLQPSPLTPPRRPIVTPSSASTAHGALTPPAARSPHDPAS